jgi:hypothetical protein
MRRLIQAGVVIVIFFLVASCFLSAIKQIKEAAERIQCSNNCKQLAIAWHNYESANGHTAPGTYVNPNLTPEQRLSWGVVLEPYLEAGVRRQFDHSRAWDAPENVARTATPFRLFVCSGVPNPESTITTCYIGIAGIGADAATLPTEESRVGAFGYDRTLKLDEFTHGKANSLLFLESMSGGPWAQGGPGSVRGLDPVDRPHHGVGRFFDGDHRSNKWFTRNTSTITATLCDGSVRTFTETTASEVLENLATVHGKDKLPCDW